MLNIKTMSMVSILVLTPLAASLATPVAVWAAAADASSSDEVSAADEKAIDARVEDMFKALNAGHVDTALGNAFLPRMSTDNKNALQGVISQIQTGISIAGTPMKYEMMTETPLASVLVARTYVMYSKDLPVRLKLMFFKTPDGWYVQSLYFDDFVAQNY